MSDWNKAIEAAAKELEKGARLHWLAAWGGGEEEHDPSLTEHDAHLLSSEELEGFAQAIRALKAPYPFCHRPEHCAGKGYCDGDPACNE